MSMDVTQEKKAEIESRQALKEAYRSAENANMVRVGDDQITTSCMVYSEDGKMKLDISLWGAYDYDESTFIEGTELDTSRLYTNGEVEILDPETGEAIAQMITYINAFYLDFYDSEYKGLSTTELSNRYTVN